MSTEQNPTNTAAAIGFTAYKLPYPSAAVEAFVVMANTANGQARSAEQSCRRALTENSNTRMAVIPAFPQLKDSFVSGVVYSAKALRLSADSCVQAQLSVCEALSYAAVASVAQQQKLSERIVLLEEEILQLNSEAHRLRGKVAGITDDPNQNDAYATKEAKKLLDVLEAAYKKHELNRALYKHQREIEANVDYLNRVHADATMLLDQVRVLQDRAEDDWQQVVTAFNIKDEPVGSKTEQPVAPQPAWTDAEQAAAATEAEEKTEQTSAWATIWSYIKIIALAFLIAMALRAYVFDVTLVEGNSMFPTLSNGDDLITVKIGYYFNQPQRGDIVVLHAPDSPGEDYIKRVIGLPNDELKISEGQVYINGQLLDEPYLDNVTTNGEENMVIPMGYYFVMGDNRDESRDSRTDKVGLISRDDILGHAVLRVYPFDSFGTLY